MIPIERIKELLPQENISDDEAKEIRDDFYYLAEIIFAQWQQKRKKTHTDNDEHCS